MTSKQALRRWKAACERWVKLLGVDDYRRVYEVYDQTRLDVLPSSGLEAAEVSVQTRYKWAKFDVYRKFIEEASDDGLDETACHEVMHVLTDPLNRVAKDLIDALPRGRREGYECLRDTQNERVVTHLEQVTRRLRRASDKR